MALPLVIVGAGSSGAVIASRLTRDPKREVVLIEAGPDYPNGLTGDLADGRRNAESHDWGYWFKPNPGNAGGAFPRGKVVGGSSSVNTCIALRGQPYDYDEWAALGGEHWRFSECLPYFKKLERDLDFDNEWHGKKGPIPIRRHAESELTRFQRAFVASCTDAGYPACPDHNDPTTTGVGPHAMNKIDGRRVGTAIGYLEPARERKNLTVLAESVVDRLDIHRRRVRGIHLIERGRPRRIEAEEVVLAAGAIGTPGILIRSGIGPRDALLRLGVDVVVDAPVGQRLLDHPGAACVVIPRDGATHGEDPVIQTTLRYQSADGPPNEMQIQPINSIHLPLVPLLCALAIVVGKPSGSGMLSFPSKSPEAKPRIVPRLGEHADDRRKLVEGLRIARKLLEHDALRDLIKTCAWPSEEMLGRRDTEWIYPGTGSGYHPCGTAPMGERADPDAVVDFHGRVRGVDGLVVADASIMPTIPSSNINIPTIMMGERFADWIAEGALFG